jgi:D-tyrosyl-tRNA(Tyr) deacylase
MRLVIQRVLKAKVMVKDTEKVSGQIGQGYLVLLGVKKNDDLTEAGLLAEKLTKLRVMSDKSDKMNLTLKDVGGEILLVSQFTLYADTSAGNRPSFINAAEPKLAKEIYDHFIVCLKKSGLKVETGSFGSYMEIEATLDGPVTILYG